MKAVSIWEYRRDLNVELLHRVGISLAQLESVLGNKQTLKWHKTRANVCDVVSSIDFDDSEFNCLF